jgi:hypothetical protein
MPTNIPDSSASCLDALETDECDDGASEARAGVGEALERADGSLVWNRRKVFISAALAHESVGIVPSDRGEWLVHFGPILLGRFDENKLDRGLRLTRRLVRGRDNDRPLRLSLTELMP